MPCTTQTFTNVETIDQLAAKHKNYLKIINEKFKKSTVTSFELEEIGTKLNEATKFCSMLPECYDKSILQAYITTVDNNWKKQWVLEKLVNKFSEKDGNMFEKLDKVVAFIDQMENANKETCEVEVVE